MDGSSSLLFVSFAIIYFSDEALVIHADVQLPPLSNLRALVPMGVPLTGTRDFECCRVDNQMERASVRSGGTRWTRHVDVFVPPRRRGVVRCFQVELHQPQQRVEESLGLSERKVKDHAQRLSRHDCQIRVARLATATAVPRWRPGFARLLAEPDRDVATALETTLILRPVGHAIGEWRGGISPPRSPRTVRECLHSHGSDHLTIQGNTEWFRFNHGLLPPGRLTL